MGSRSAAPHDRRPYIGRSSAHLGPDRRLAPGSQPIRTILLVVTKHAASLLALSFVLVACGGWEGGQTPGTQTVLQIKVWPNGKDGEAPREWRLHCDRAGGTHPAPEKACEQLFGLADPFAPIPGDAVCTEIYGGPAVAEVEGLYRGETVDAKFTRTNGCEIDRWDRHAFLFPIEQDPP